MGFFELFLLAAGLSMDAFAVAVCIGLAAPEAILKKALMVGLYFGVFQAFMPLIGYAAAALLEDKRDGSRQIQKDISIMMNVFDERGVKDVIVKGFNSLALDTGKVDCDCYRCLDGDKDAQRTWAGEFMSAYTWAEHITGYLDRRLI